MSITEKELNQFTGTENYYQFICNIKLTDGVKFLAEKAGAYWLLDVVASYQITRRVCKERFQIWMLDLSPENKRTGRKEATVEMRPDSDKPAMIRQHIAYTDFPLEHIKLYLVDGVLMLPSEY